MIWSAISGALTAISNPITAWVKGSAEEKKIVREGELRLSQAKLDARINRIKAGNEASEELDLISSRRRDWKASLTLILILIPLVMSFMPEYVDDAKAGFAALDDLPEYYKYALLAILVDIWSFRRIFRTFLTSYLPKQK